MSSNRPMRLGHWCRRRYQSLYLPKGSSNRRPPGWQIATEIETWPERLRVHPMRTVPLSKHSNHLGTVLRPPLVIVVPFLTSAHACVPFERVSRYVSSLLPSGSVLVLYRFSGLMAPLMVARLAGESSNRWPLASRKICDVSSRKTGPHPPGPVLWTRTGVIAGKSHSTCGCWRR